MQSSAKAETGEEDGGEHDGAAPFLGVARSFAGKPWRLRPADDRLALTLSQRLGLSDFVARILAARGITPDTAETYLAPSLRTDLPDPSTLRDMDAAASRLADAIEAREPIAIFGDYDVDGATSTALLLRFLRALGSDARPYIPDRMREGYGPNPAAMRVLAEEGAKLVITVDCGTMAHEALAAGVEAGLDIVVVDHHKAAPDLPSVNALVNPNRLDCTSKQGQLAAVGVAFMLVVAVNRELRARGFYGAERMEPDLRQWLDLVALGTVCDVVPLTGVNRALVVQGMKVMAARGNAGLAALADVAGMKEQPGPYHAGFLLGPRVNAGGRVGASGLGTQLLASDDPAEAAKIAARLDALNKERQAIEAEVLEHVLGIAERDGLAGAPVGIAAGEGWHPGVIGIVASRLKERTRKPAIVISLDEKGVGKGSGRSIAGVDLGAAVVRALEAGLLINGGGHSMAAGLTVAADQVDALKDFLTEDLRDAVETAAARDELVLDGAISLSGATASLYDDIQRAGPYGAGNAEPRLAVTDLRPAFVDVVGSGHVRMTLRGEGKGSLKAVAFRAADQPLGQALLAGNLGRIHVAGRIKRDTWRGGEAVEMHLDDAASAGD